MPTHKIHETMNIHRLTIPVIDAFYAISQERAPGSCPYQCELDATEIAGYLSGCWNLNRYYKPVAFDAMGCMIDSGHLEKVTPGKFHMGDTLCRPTQIVEFPAPTPTPHNDRIGLSNDWLAACQELENLICRQGGLFDRFSTNAVLAALNYLLVNQAWKQRHVPDDIHHAFLESPIYAELCQHLWSASEEIEPFQILIPQDHQTPTTQ